MTFRIIGGIIGYFTCIDLKSESVTKQYHSVIGFPVLIPY